MGVDRYESVGSLGLTGDSGVGYARRTGPEGFDYAFAWPEGEDGRWATLSGGIDLADQPTDFVDRVLDEAGVYPGPGEEAEGRLRGLMDACGDRWQTELMKLLLCADVWSRYEVPEHHMGARAALDAVAAAMGELAPFEPPRGGRATDRAHSEAARDWYMASYPDDTLGREIPGDVTMGGLIDAVAQHADFYDAMGVGDSVIRERFFEEIADRLGVGYEDVYNASFCDMELPASVRLDDARNEPLAAQDRDARAGETREREAAGRDDAR